MARSDAPSEPITGPDLVLWLDAQDIEGRGDAARSPPHGAAISIWADKSSYHHDARQAAAEQRPSYVRSVLDNGLHAVRFRAAGKQFLSAGNPAGLDLPTVTAFVVARAGSSGSDMWLFSKNHWGPPWTGYGIAVSNDGLHPWPHLGLDTGAHGYFKFGGNLKSGFRVVEVCYDGKIAKSALDDRPDSQQVGQRQDRRQRPRSADRHAGVSIPGRRHRRDPHLPPGAERPGTTADQTLSAGQVRPADELRAGRMIHRWYRTGCSRPRGIRWRSGSIRRFSGRASWRLAWPGTLERRTSAGIWRNSMPWLRVRPPFPGTALSRATVRERYLAVRQLKRRIMLKNPLLDFQQLLCIDQPYPEGSEWKHQAIHRLGHRAVPGGRLLILEGLDPSAPARPLGPEKPGSYWRRTCPSTVNACCSATRRTTNRASICTRSSSTAPTFVSSRAAITTTSIPSTCRTATSCSPPPAATPTSAAGRTSIRTSSPAAMPTAGTST